MACCYWSVNVGVYIVNSIASETVKEPPKLDTDDEYAVSQFLLCMLNCFSFHDNEQWCYLSFVVTPVQDLVHELLMV